MSVQQHAPAALYLRERPVPIVQEAGWGAPGPVWTGGKSRPHRDSIPNRIYIYIYIITGMLVFKFVATYHNALDITRDQRMAVGRP